MKITATFILIFVFSMMSCKQKPEEKKEEIKVESKEMKTDDEPKIEIKNDALKSVLNVNAPIEILTGGFTWSEGPVWIEEHQMVLFSDVWENIAYKWSDANGLEEYLNPSGCTSTGVKGELGSNGLLLNPEGKLILSQHGDRRMAMMDAPLDAPESKFITIADNFEGKKFSSPNDATYHKNGDLYFTDPPYGLNDDGYDESPRKETEFNGVYKVDKMGKVTVVDKELTRPNGIAFSPDFSKLYVANSDPKKAFWKVYDVDENGDVSNGKVFYDVTSLVGEENKGLPDGLKVDNEGNLFATGPGGIFIISPEGTHLGTINTKKATANCGFNSDKSVLYITAHTHLMRLKIK